MGTHPIFESDFDCLTDCEHGECERKRKADDSEMEQDRPYLAPIKASQMGSKKKALDVRRVVIPQNRLTPLKEQRQKLYEPIVKQLKLEIRFNAKRKVVELRASKSTTEISALQKGVDFVTAFTYGFDIDDSLALVRLDQLFLETFQVEDVKQTLKGDHLSRAIGRVSGTGGRTKYTIENVTKTRLVVADKRIHILGSFQNIQVARRAICALILGSPPAKVYGNMRNAAARTGEKY